MTESEAIEYLSNYKYDNETKQAIDIVLNSLKRKDDELKKFRYIMFGD